MVRVLTYFLLIDGVEREEGDETFTVEGVVTEEKPAEAESEKPKEAPAPEIKQEKTEEKQEKPEEKKADEAESTSNEEAKTKEGEEAKPNEDNTNEGKENNANSQVFRIEETYSYMTKKKMEEAKEKIEKYFDKNGKELSIDSVYLSMVYAGYLSR